MHRFVLAEFNTHRAFSRNSASSRAIPIKKRIAAIRDDLAYPVEWGSNQRGMQAGHILNELATSSSRSVWKAASEVAISGAEALNTFGVHKQIVNRLLEPFLWHTVIVSSTEWDNFFKQRCSSLAQPEIRVVAEAMRDALNESTPNRLEVGQWHTPYIQPDECNLRAYDRIKISAARCARVSYLTHDGRRDHDLDFDLYEKLVEADPPHWSPLEHVATPLSNLEDDPSWVGNFEGWAQWRHLSSSRGFIN
jgi:hypothetical protein